MSNILALYSSANSENSTTYQLAKGWLDAQQGNIVERDLVQNPIPHLDESTVASFYTPPEHRSEAQLDVIKLSNQLVSEVREADTVIITAPMYNFGIPSSLKAWIDHVARVGETFNYTEQGPVGLLGSKKAILVTSRGGVYGEGLEDHQIPYLKQFLSWLGFTEVDVVYAQGIAYGDDAKAASISKATEELKGTAPFAS